MNQVKVRTATIEDAEELLNIYAYYVKNTAITFEYEVPSIEEFQHRISKTLEKYPYLVIEKEGKIFGYAYAGALKERAAYGWCVELSIYLDNKAQKCGFGRILYEALENELKTQGYLNLYACIGYPIEEDEYLTKNSAQFHEHLGYRKIGEFYRCGYKFERWYNMIWMEKIIGDHTTVAPIKKNQEEKSDEKRTK